jgi:antitoxin component of MazEF toxin-antitoxin module
MGMGLKLIKVGKVSANNSWPIIYLPREVTEKLGLRKGVKVFFEVDEEKRALIIRRVD